MKQLLGIVVGVIITVGLVVFGFTLRQTQQQQDSLTADLQIRTRLLADSLKESVEPYYLNNSLESLQKVMDRFANRERLVGIAVYGVKNDLVAASTDLPENLVENSEVPGRAMDSNKTAGEFIKLDDNSLFVFAEPLHQDDKVAGALVVVQKADYIDLAISQTWKNNLLRLLLQTLIFSVALVLAVRLLMLKPLIRFVESVKLARAGLPDKELSPEKNHSFFRPLANELSKMSRSLLQARSAASEEARMRLEKIDSPWTEERLKEFIKAYLPNKKIFIVSNREPYIHHLVKNKVEYYMPAGGAVTALEGVMEACGGMWLAHGSGDADKQTVDENDKIMVPPEEPKYTLKRIWLTPEEEKGYYAGFSNEALWPLCHIAHTRPIFRQEDWVEYRRVNGKFVETLLTEIKDVQQPIILVQDFHFALLPQMIKNSRPDAQVGLFWHVPWPSPESFSICPWRKEILEGMLGADVISFHTQQYCNNFMDTVGKEIESLVSLEHFSITLQGHQSYIKPFPISIALTHRKQEATADEDVKKEMKKLGITTKYIGIGVDRLDYTKGILERLKGIEFFLDNHPEYHKKFTFLQIAAPTREAIEKYRQFSEEVSVETERINGKFKDGNWQPIVLIKESKSREEIYTLYRQANLCLVTSLHDGMNLVAKEFVAAREDETGVLILSQFTGAARDLKDALIINPYSAEQTADAIHQALIMPLNQQHTRMKKMRESVKNYNIYRWSAEFIKSVANLG